MPPRRPRRSATPYAAAPSSTPRASRWPSRASRIRARRTPSFAPGATRWWPSTRPLTTPPARGSGRTRRRGASAGASRRRSARTTASPPASPPCCTRAPAPDSRASASLARRRGDALAGALVDVDLPRIVAALGADRLHVVGDRLAPPPRRIGRSHVRGLGVVKGDAAAPDRTDHGRGLVDVAGQKVALHALDQVVLKDAQLVAAVDEKHAAVLRIDVVQRDPAGDPLVVEVAPPVALVLVPVGRHALRRRLAEELVVPELHLLVHQVGAERGQPLAVGLVGDLLPDEGGRRLHDAERPLVLRFLDVPRPVVGQPLLLGEDAVAVALELVEIGLGDRVLDDQPAVFVEEVELGLGGLWIGHGGTPGGREASCSLSRI